MFVSAKQHSPTAEQRRITMSWTVFLFISFPENDIGKKNNINVTHKMSSTKGRTLNWLKLNSVYSLLMHFCMLKPNPLWIFKSNFRCDSQNGTLLRNLKNYTKTVKYFTQFNNKYVSFYFSFWFTELTNSIPNSPHTTIHIALCNNYCAFAWYEWLKQISP